MPAKNHSRHIQLLPPELRDQIAAGEVVERPASVLKELLENSLDAGADDIAVTLEDGGQTCISVQDNGQGIAADELELAVTSHATSKIHSFAELLRVTSYGFRGEALPSIGSVARLRVSSLRENEGKNTTGRFIDVQYGKVTSQGAAALNRGTLVEVRDLFSNVPARLKFLKTNFTELKRCQEVILRLALANTQAGFAFSSGGREIYNFVKAESLTQRLSKIWPPQISAELAPFELERQGMRVRGLASHPSSAQPRGDRMFFYVNGRAVNGKLLQRAAREAYKGRLLAREYPQLVLFIDIDPEEVDVNVHPSKSEVRFRDEKTVFGVVMRAVESAGESAHTTAQIPHASVTLAEERPQGFWGSIDNPSIINARQAELVPSLEELLSDDYSEAGRLREDAAPYGAVSSISREHGEKTLPENIFGQTSTAFAKASSVPPCSENAFGQMPELLPKDEAAAQLLPEGMAYLGQVADTYLVVLRGKELLLFDQHAVHERILVNRFQREAGSGQSQLLAIPVEMRLHEAEREHLQDIWGELAKLGFSLSLPAASVLQIKGIPPLLNLGESREFLRGAMAEKGCSLEDLLNMMACKGAIKAGQVLSNDEALALIHKWLQTPGREFCPHGRPAVLALGERELEKMFKRKS